MIDEFFVSESGGSRNIPAIPCRREEYVCVCALSDRDRGLRYRLPELGVMSEKDPRPAPFQPRSWALFVWGYALVWFLVTDRVKLLAYRIFNTMYGRTARH